MYVIRLVDIIWTDKHAHSVILVTTNSYKMVLAKPVHYKDV